MALDTQQARKEYSKKRHDVNAKHRYFEKEDNVVFILPLFQEITDMLSDMWQGPYEVLGR